MPRSGEFLGLPYDWRKPTPTASAIDSGTSAIGASSRRRPSAGACRSISRLADACSAPLSALATAPPWGGRSHRHGRTMSLPPRSGGEERMIQQADAVVIGPGAFGASTAYHLARRGKRVALLDKFDVASQTSPRAAGLTQQIRTDALMTRLAMRSVRKIVDFEADTGQALAYHQSGSIKLARTAAFAAQIEDELKRGQAVGLDIEPITLPTPIGLPRSWWRTRRAPSGTPAPTCTWSRAIYPWPTSGRRPVPRRPGPAAHGGHRHRHPRRRRRARRDHRGRDPRHRWWSTPPAPGHAWWVRYGIRVPVVPTRHQLYVARPIAGVEAEQPIVRVLDVNVYVRPERGGLMLGGYEPDRSRSTSGRSRPSSRSPTWRSTWRRSASSRTRSAISFRPWPAPTSPSSGAACRP